ncbi:type II toxin-antitoxin system RelE/ParE family toxin [Candidatus Parcubacteria bacterium]|nr:type II toxin-antitoxin system RelE/ParE family toxin [Candidatus Parcubacteria bacterium]
MPWSIFYTRSAEGELGRIDRAVRKRVIAKVEWLAEHFDDVVPLPLHGPFRGLFKFAVGDWRIVYDFESTKNRIVIHHIGHRSKIYE